MPCIVINVSFSKLGVPFGKCLLGSSSGIFVIFFCLFISNFQFKSSQLIVIVFVFALYFKNSLVPLWFWWQNDEAINVDFGNSAGR